MDTHIQKMLQRENAYFGAVRSNKIENTRAKHQQQLMTNTKPIMHHSVESIIIHQIKKFINELDITKTVQLHREMQK